MSIPKAGTKPFGLADATFVLTEEGEEYKAEGSPEVRLVAFLKGRKAVNMRELASASPDFDVSIAVQWAKRNGWIEVVEGEVSLRKMPEGDEIKEALEAVSHGMEIENKILEVLLQRKLVSEKRIDRLTRAKSFVGREITGLTPDLIATGLWREVKLKPYNVEVVGRKVYPGKRQPYLQFVGKMKRKLIELGFKEITGPLVETEFWNFDALYQPQNHPARDWASTYQLKHPHCGRLPESKLVEKVKKAHETGISGSRGWGYKWSPKKAMQLMPRAHGTCLSARKLASNPEIPGKYFAIARCYRPDILDSTHLIEFNQVEGIVIDESLNLKSLLGILEIFAREIAGAEKLKFFPDYYPFTEPSVQLSAKHPEMGWMEFGGSGIFREELTMPLGIETPVIAWGIGIDRLAMFKLGIEDIRYLFSYDLKWLREAKMVI